MNILVSFYYVFTLLIFRINGVKENTWKLSREEVVMIDKQIQLQNNFTAKTIRTRHGDLYDCVDFYKQPAFNHHLSKNHSFIPKNIPTLSHEKSRNKSYIISPKFGLNGRGCPDGTVPIKRATKDDLIRVKLAQRNDGTRYARCSADMCGEPECMAYSGITATAAYYNPKVTSNQYSAAVMKLQIGPDSIEAGWRVDPQLYGDTKTRLYIHTDARDIHCFNTLCPGFVITNKDTPLDFAFNPVSEPGGDTYGVDITIIQDNANGNWILRIEGAEVGYWPNNLFQQPGLAQHVEWGGEVFSLKGMHEPGMGSGIVVTEDTKQDAFYAHVKVQKGSSSGRDNFVDPVNLSCKANVIIYDAIDEGNVGKDLEYLIIYGGRSDSDKNRK